MVDGHVFKVPLEISAWNRYGLEIAPMIPWTSAVVHLEHFDYNILQETIDFYAKFTGYTLTEQETQYILDGLTPTEEKGIAN